MAEEKYGEWKLLKVWECHKCKTLVRDGRKVYEHKCHQNGEKTEEEKVKVVEKIVERIVYVGAPTPTTPTDKITTPTDTITNIDDTNVETTTTDKITNVETTTTDKITNVDIETTDKITQETDTTDKITQETDTTDKITQETDTTEETDTTDKITNEDISNEIRHSVFDISELRDMTNEDLDFTSENNIVETEKMCLDVWKEDAKIKDSKDTGYRDDVEIEIFERGKGKKRVVIKNGRVHKKPEGIEIIGQNSPSGFIVQGVIKRI